MLSYNLAKAFKARRIRLLVGEYTAILGVWNGRLGHGGLVHDELMRSFILVLSKSSALGGSCP